jgi:hypothetical protein
MNQFAEKLLLKEAIKLYGIANKKDLSVTFQDMTLSIQYNDKVPEEVEAIAEAPVDEGAEIVEQIEAENAKVQAKPKSKPKGKGRGRKKK